ncbi:alpha/beta fold hydrolase [Evansella sp. AB-P1]|uniref:alpha/beta hydrolase n=1 Tax=Evansella sp. AB-P1 TaxID=3037653 RepID=UPI00241DFC51|nr:alpha/beta fold hydrolase [Evansella sp. AB-P1]MDG5789851.1 alpha/beta fold hydrolase [Evansella sp. AB-P1]
MWFIKGKVGKMIGGIISLFFLVVFLMYSGFYFFQDRLLFYPQGISDERIQYIHHTYDHVEEVELQVSEEVSTHGWLVHNNNRESPSPVLIYFGGNAEEVSHLIHLGEDLGDHSVLLMNYRGYGRSGGSPSEEAMFHDALHMYDYLASRDDIDGEQISVMGRSMGTGIAVYLGAERELDKIVLVSPYDSLTNVSRDRYPFLPVQWLLKHHFDNVSRAEHIDTSMLTLIAEEDRIIPPSHSMKLVETWQGDAEQIIFEGRNHNNIQSSEDYWTEIANFLELD